MIYYLIINICTLNLTDCYKITDVSTVKNVYLVKILFFFSPNVLSINNCKI